MTHSRQELSPESNQASKLSLQLTGNTGDKGTSGKTLHRNHETNPGSDSYKIKKSASFKKKVMTLRKSEVLLWTKTIMDLVQGGKNIIKAILEKVGEA